MIIHSMQQGSAEWHDIRKLKLTASHAQAIASAGKGLGTYTTEIVSKYFSTGEEKTYLNDEMQRGLELESEARTIYEFETGNEIKEVGFVEYNKYIGCSPDGLIDEDGGIEIKIHNDKVYTELLLHNKIDTKYLWQIQMNLFITGRQWFDYVAYNPNFKKTMYVKRIKRGNGGELDILAKGLTVGTDMLIKKIKKMEQSLLNL